jgi:hypothetical protein
MVTTIFYLQQFEEEKKYQSFLKSVKTELLVLGIVHWNTLLSFTKLI